MTEAPVASGRRYLLVGAAWLVAASVAGITGRVEALRPPAPQLVLALLTGLVILAFFTAAAFRSWALGLSIRVLLGFHLIRFVGLYFLALHARGELPYEFAVPGGWGDIMVATSALALLALPGDPGHRPGLLLAWNLFGLADILFVVGTAARLAFANPPSMAALMRFPLSLVPTFLVPLIIASHVVLLERLRRGRTTGPA